MANPNDKSEHTVRLHRVFKTNTERLYRAFLDADAIAKWLPPNGYTCEVFTREPKLGGKYHMSFTNFADRQKQGWRGEFLELVPGKLLKYCDEFEGSTLPGKMVTTVNLREVSCGTEITIVQENIPSGIPVEQCYLGWQDSLKNLATLVES